MGLQTGRLPITLNIRWIRVVPLHCCLFPLARSAVITGTDVLSERHKRTVNVNHPPIAERLKDTHGR